MSLTLSKRRALLPTQTGIDEGRSFNGEELAIPTEEIGMRTKTVRMKEISNTLRSHETNSGSALMCSPIGCCPEGAWYSY